MKKIEFTAAAVSLALAIVAPAASARTATYTSQLNYKDTGAATLFANPFGLVTINELDATDVKVTVTLYAPESGFLNTGGPHNPFVFNLTGNYGVTVTDTGAQTFFNGGYNAPGGTAFDNTPFGYFTNEIGCCDAPNDIDFGAGAQSHPPLVFTVHDAAGITFAGAGATFSNTGQLLTMGTGDHFMANTSGDDHGGWLFSADLVNATGNTFNVAARDSFVKLQNAVPEPAIWTMMIMGFGGVGAVLRRRRAAPLPA